MMTTKPSADDGLLAAVPALPAKSSRRMTSLLASLPHKIDAEDQATVLSQATPHDHYLSSEEDASSSADDLSDYSLDSDDELSPMSTESPAHQITARAVSVIFSGKPSIVNLPARTVSPTTSSPPQSRPVTRSSTEIMTPPNPSFAKRMSIMSFRSASMPGNGNRPASAFVDLGDQRRMSRPNFLDSDPFPSTEEPTATSPRLQRAPSTMFKRTFNLVRRKSRPQLYQSATMSRESLALCPEQHEEPSPSRKSLKHSATMPLTNGVPSSPSKLRLGSLSIHRPRTASRA